MAVDDVYRVEVFQNVGSEQTMNVLHLREVTAETVLANPAENVVGCVAGIYLSLAAELSEDWRVIQITGQMVHPSKGIPFTSVRGAGNAIEGAIVGDIIPSQAAVLISFYTFNTSRSGRGRIYLPGLPEIAQNEGQIVEATVTNLQVEADASFTEVLGPTSGGDGTYRVCVFNNPLITGSTQDVVQATVRPNLATQRRRRAFPGFGG